MVAHALPAALTSVGETGVRLPRALLVGALLALFVRAFVGSAAVVPTGSMAPAIAPGDRVWVDRMIYSRGLPAALAKLLPVRAPRVGDVVWARSPVVPGAALVKRVAALAGQPFADAVVPAARLAVLGDRRDDSLDSRQFGTLPVAAVRGRVCLVLWSSPAGGGLRRLRLLRPVR